ncbi:hypothetical protein GY45DRAFT_700988 [Cubamyces sp. BRFM 1775]|nr:hypothetical protein GY45DRAFT_700988 [Cubamyces sp. BRFM 1775]
MQIAAARASVASSPCRSQDAYGRRLPEERRALRESAGLVVLLPPLRSGAPRWSMVGLPLPEMKVHDLGAILISMRPMGWRPRGFSALSCSDGLQDRRSPQIQTFISYPTGTLVVHGSGSRGCAARTFADVLGLLRRLAPCLAVCAALDVSARHMYYLCPSRVDRRWDIPGMAWLQFGRLSHGSLWNATLPPRQEQTCPVQGLTKVCCKVQRVALYLYLQL